MNRLAVGKLDADAAAVLALVEEDFAHRGAQAQLTAVALEATHERVDDCATPTNRVIHARAVLVQVVEHVDHRRGHRAVRGQAGEGEGEKVEPVEQEGVGDASSVEHRAPRPGEQVGAQSNPRIGHRGK